MQTYSELLAIQNLTESTQLTALKANQVVQNKLNRKWIQRLTNNLAFALQIPEGDHLTFILGYGECTSNHQALYAWVEEQIESNHYLEKENSNELFNTLKLQLQHQLSTPFDEYPLLQGGF